jgi:hypothetical protein
MIAVAGPVMALVQALAVRVEPGIGALCAGASGIAVVLVVRRMPHGSRPVEPDRWRPSDQSALVPLNQCGLWRASLLGLLPPS